MGQSVSASCLRMVAIATLLAVLALFAGEPPRGASAAFTYVAPPFEQQDFLTAFPNDGHFGPTGLAFYPNGDILVADAADGNLYRFGPNGGAAGAPFASGGTTLGLAFGRDGRLFAAQRSSSSIVELDPSDGHVTRTVASGFSNLIAGLAVDPTSTDLFVTDQGANRYASAPGVFRVRPSDGSVSPYSTGPLFSSADGLVLDSDGTLYVSNERGSGNVVRVDRQGNASVLITISGGPDGLAIGKAGTALAGSLFVNGNDGVLNRIDLTQTPATLSVFASGGTRGDFVAVSPDGFLLATQTDRVVRFSPASFQPTPSAGGTSSIPFYVYLALVLLVLIVLSSIGAVSWRRRRALVRVQLAATAGNPELAAAQPLPQQPPASRSAVVVQSAPAAARLVVTGPDETAVSFDVGEAPAAIGSGRDCAVRLPASGDVAPEHARIWLRNGVFTLRHIAGPRYRTTVAGQRIDLVNLEPGDVITIGGHRITFESLS